MEWLGISPRSNRRLGFNGQCFQGIPGPRRGKKERLEKGENLGQDSYSPIDGPSPDPFHRLGWTGPIPVTVSLFAIVNMMGGSALPYCAMKSNPFFDCCMSPERQGTPGCQPGALWLYPASGLRRGYFLQPCRVDPAGVISGVGGRNRLALLLVARTVLEDKTLRQELKGYHAYVKRVRAKLIPFIW